MSGVAVTPKPDRIVRCPACAGDAVMAASNAYRPFCSKRCRELDLGAWASERYRVADSPSDDADDAAPKVEPDPLR